MTDNRTHQLHRPRPNGYLEQFRKEQQLKDEAVAKEFADRPRETRLPEHDAWAKERFEEAQRDFRAVQRKHLARTSVAPDYEWISTASGGKFHYGMFDGSQYNLRDAASALSRQCRYAGHLHERYADDTYSVAQHLVLVVKLLRMVGKPRASQRWGGAHDLTEAWWQDIVSPNKRRLPTYVADEEREQDALRKWYRIEYNPTIAADVNWADKELARAEMLELQARRLDATKMPQYTLFQIDPDFRPWRPREARDRLLETLEELDIKD